MPLTREYKEAVYKFGRRLKAWREAAGLSQPDLAKALGVTQQTVSDWEHGATLPRLSRAEKIEAALGLAPGEAGRMLLEEGREVQPDEDADRPAALSGKIERLPESSRRAIEALVDEMLGPEA